MFNFFSENDFYSFHENNKVIIHETQSAEINPINTSSRSSVLFGHLQELTIPTILFMLQTMILGRTLKTQQDPSKHSSWRRRLEAVFWRRKAKANILVLIETSWRRLQDVFWRWRQKMSSRRLRQDHYIRLGHTSSRRFQDVSSS